MVLRTFNLLSLPAYWLAYGLAALALTEQSIPLNQRTTRSVKTQYTLKLGVHRLMPYAQLRSAQKQHVMTQAEDEEPCIRTPQTSGAACTGPTYVAWRVACHTLDSPRCEQLRHDDN